MTSITVVLPTFNASKTIARAIDSILYQTILPDQIILIDDCSSDSTVHLIDSHPQLEDFSNKLILATPTNSGPGIARNLGWDHASSEFVAFLDADDVWHPQKLELQREAMILHPWASFSGHRYRVTMDISSDFPRFQQPSYRELHMRHFLFSNRFSTPSVVLRRDINLRFGVGEGVSDDYLLWLQLLARGERALLLDAPLVYLQKPAYGGGGLSGQLMFMQRRELATFEVLRREDILSRFESITLQLYSMIKFLRRLVIVAIRKIRR
ncbi:MAG: glycosyltransferase family 2 protein [Actinomycetota bacterium]